MIRKKKRRLAFRKAIKVGALLTTVMAFVLAAVPLGEAKADELDLSKPMSLVVSFPQKHLDGLKAAGVVLDVYQVAKAEKIDGFDTFKFVANNDFSDLAQDVQNPDVSNEDWKGIAQKASNLVLVKGSKVSPIDKEPFGFKDGDSIQVTLPGGGLYLVVPRGKNAERTAPDSYSKESPDGSGKTTYASSTKKKYTFTPQLVAVPGKPQYDNNNTYINNNTANTGPWEYDIKVDMTMKVGVEDLEAKIRIKKTLLVYETKYPATFTFKITATLPPDDRIVYSDVVDIVFNSYGEKTYEVTGLPVGALVTVTEEIKKGDNYRLVSSDVEELKDPLVATFVPEARFVNTYDERYHGGGSALNVFTKKPSQSEGVMYQPDKVDGLTDKEQLEAEKALK